MRGFILRFIAYIIDIFVYMFFLTPMILVTLLFVDIESARIIFYLLVCFIWGVLRVIVPLFFEEGQTIGKKIMKIKLVKINGMEISAKDMITREIIGLFNLFFVSSSFLISEIRTTYIITLGIIFILNAIYIIQSKVFIHEVLSNTRTTSIIK